MRLKVIICVGFCLMPIYADGDYGDESESPASGEDRAISEPPSSDIQDNAKSESSSNTNKWVNLSGNFALVTDYVYRGQTQTFGGPAAQGGFTLSQKPDEGLYAGVWGSNVNDTTATNGAGLELDLCVGFIYKRDNDLSFNLKLLNTRYPGAYASLPTKDKFDTLEVISEF